MLILTVATEWGFLLLLLLVSVRGLWVSVSTFTQQWRISPLRWCESEEGNKCKKKREQVCWHAYLWSQEMCPCTSSNKKCSTGRALLPKWEEITSCYSFGGGQNGQILFYRQMPWVMHHALLPSISDLTAFLEMTFRVKVSTFYLLWIQFFSFEKKTTSPWGFSVSIQIFWESFS